MPGLHLITESCVDSICQNEQVFQCDLIDQLDQQSLLQEAVRNSSAQWFLLTGSIDKPSQIPDAKSLDEIQTNGSAVWLPKVESSFADFAVRSLGAKMASLWFPLWESGSMIVSAQSLRSALEQCNSLNEVILNLSWSELPEVDFLEINWCDDSVILPELVPTQQRSGLNQVEPLIRNLKDWMPDEFDRSSPDFVAIGAGLYQWYDALEVSHGYSQDAQHEGVHRAADYWHAIMHRREPDASNSKYWWRHVGDHPVFAQLFQFSQQVCEEVNRGSSWDSFAFVDYCSRALRDSEKEIIAERIQAIEMVLLMQQTMRDAQR